MEVFLFVVVGAPAVKVAARAKLDPDLVVGGRIAALHFYIINIYNSIPSI